MNIYIYIYVYSHDNLMYHLPISEPASVSKRQDKLSSERSTSVTEPKPISKHSETQKITIPSLVPMEK